MTSQKKRYLFIAIFFIALTVVGLVSVFYGNLDKKNLLYIGVCGLIGLLFLKNALSRQ